MKHILQHLPHDLFHLDQKGILKNIVSVLQPQQTVSGYLQGKRAGFFSPFLFFLFGVGLILFIEGHTDKMIMLQFEVVTGTDSAGNDIMSDGGKTLTKWLKYLFFISSFFFALPNWLIFKKSTGYTFAEHVIVSQFVLGYANLGYLLMLVFPFTQMYPVSPVYGGWVLFFYSVVLYSKNIWLTLLRVFCSMTLQSVLLLLILSIVACIDIYLLQ